MPLSERSRSVLYRRLTTLIDDEEAVGELLANLTAVEAEQVATKDFVRAEVTSASVRIIMWTVTTNVATTALLLTLLR